MKTTGTKPDGIEVGNAWKCREPGSQTNWIIGTGATIPRTSLRFMEQKDKKKDRKGRKAKNVCVKWFVHRTSQPVKWGRKKPTSKGRTISLLAGDGEFELVFWQGDQEYKVILNRPGDFAIWGPGLEHSWKPIQTSTIVTIRWVPL